MVILHPTSFSFSCFFLMLMLTIAFFLTKPKFRQVVPRGVLFLFVCRTLLCFMAGNDPLDH